jgi:hypothetical protein
LATEQVVGSLAFYLDAPVPPIAHVEVPQTLITASGLVINNTVALAGVHHGSRWQPDCSGRLWIANDHEPQNRERFAVLCLLYTWVVASDHQLIYRNTTPHLVFSVDHGHFLPGGPGWSAATLQGAAQPLVDPNFATLALDHALFQSYVQRLAALTPEVLAASLARVHQSWGVPDSDLLTLGEFLLGRVAATVQLFA